MVELTPALAVETAVVSIPTCPDICHCTMNTCVLGYTSLLAVMLIKVHAGHVFRQVSVTSEGRFA